MIEVRVRKGESLDEALERFGRKVEADGLMQEVLRHHYYQKPSAVARLKSKRQGRFFQRF